jgi:hypothetical protein
VCGSEWTKKNKKCIDKGREKERIEGGNVHSAKRKCEKGSEDE